MLEVTECTREEQSQVAVCGIRTVYTNSLTLHSTSSVNFKSYMWSFFNNVLFHLNVTFSSRFSVKKIICFLLLSTTYNFNDFMTRLKLLIVSQGSVHILYNADGVGGGFRFCYSVLYMVGGGGFDFCYITLLKFLTYVIF